MKTQFTLRLPYGYFRFEKVNMGKGDEVYFPPSVQR